MEDDWETYLKNIDLNSYMTNRTCDVFFCAERSFDYLYFMEELCLGSSLDKRNQVKCLTFNDLKLDIINAASALRTASNSTAENILEKAAMKYNELFLQDKSVSVPVIALLIKIQILRLMENDEYLEKCQIYHIQKLAASRLEIVEVPGGKGKDSNKQGKATKDKKSAKQGTAGKHKKGGNVKDNIDPCIKILKMESKYGSSLNKRHPEQKQLQLDKIQAPLKHLYITLLNFFEPNLLEALISIGVPLTAIIEIGNSDINISNIPYTPIILTKLAQFFVSDSISTHADNSKPSESQSHVSHTTNSNTSSTLHSVQKRKSYDTILQHFWKSIYDFFQSDKQFVFLEDTFHCQYVPKNLQTSCVETVSIEKLNVGYLEEFSDFMRSLSDVHRQYATYMRKLKLWDLGPQLKPLNVRCLKTYQKSMDFIPTECFTVSLLLNCLIEEVCVQVEKNPISSSVNPKRNSINLKQESVVLDDHYIEKPVQKYFYSDSVKQQLLAVITKYSKLNEPKQKNSFNLESYFPKTATEINFKQFRVHEDNILEVKINPYNKKLARYLFEVNMKDFLSIPPVLQLIKNANQEKQIEFERNICIWSKELSIPTSHLFNIINIWTFLKNKQKKKIIFSKSDSEIELIRRFPTKTKSLYLDEIKIKFKSSNNSSISSEKQELSANRFENIEFSNELKEKEFENNFNLKYYEYNPNCILLQQIFAAFNEFNSFDCEYVSETNSVVLHFYNDLDENDIYTEVFDQSLRTPLCIRDFCRFVIHEDTKWIAEQENLYQKEVQEQKEKELRKDPIYESPGNLTTLEYIQPGSLKEALLLSEIKKGDDKTQKNKTGKPGEKGAKDGKGGKKGKVEKGGKEIGVQYFKQLENINPSPISNEKLVVRTAAADEKFDFLGYDLAEARVQLTGSNITLSSKDGLKVTVDQTHWLGSKKTTSIKINTAGNLVLLHLTEDFRNCPLLIHLYLTDGTVIAFQKPDKEIDTTNVLSEMISRAVDDDRNFGIKNERQNIYCVSQKQKIVTKTLNAPIKMNRNIIITQSSLKPFLEKLEVMKIKHNVSVEPNGSKDNSSYDASQSTTENKFVEDDESSVSSKSSEHPKKVNLPRLKVIVPQMDLPAQPENLDNVLENQSLRKKDFNDSTFQFYQLKLNDLILELKKASERNYPMFKICSSPLHKNEYVKRIKSFVEIPTPWAIYRVLLKSSMPKPQLTYEVSKCYPIFDNGVESKNITSSYKMKLSLASGLMVATIPGFDQAPFQIKQYYIEKSSVCKSVVEEEYRIFHEGNIIIKKCDGNFWVLNVNGIMTNFEVPYFKKSENVKFISQNKTKLSTKTKGAPLHIYTENLSKLQKLTHRRILRRQKHTIDSYQSRLYRSRKAMARRERKKIQRNKFYFIKECSEPFTDFKILSPEGKQIKAKSTKLYKSRKYHVSCETDFNTEEMIMEREDGLICYLNRDTVLVTQFPDDTRITTTVIIEDKLVYAFDEEEKACLPPDVLECNAEQCPFLNLNSNSSSKKDTGWVILSLKYEYEHPCYAKVIYSNLDHGLEIELPNKVSLKYNNQHGKFTVHLNAAVKTELSPKILNVVSNFCDICNCHSNCMVNVKPIYNSQEYGNKEVIRFCDSHGKNYTAKFENNYIKFYSVKKKTENLKHCEHDYSENQKLFVVKTNFDGCQFYDSKVLLKNKQKKNFNQEMLLYKDENEKHVNCIKFQTNMKDYYLDRFLRPYVEPRLWLTKDRPSHKNSEKVAYFTYRTIYALPPLEKMEPLYEVIDQMLKETNLNINFEQILKTLRRMGIKDDIIELETMTETVKNDLMKTDDLVQKAQETLRHNEYRHIKKFSIRHIIGKLNFNFPILGDIEIHESEILNRFHEANSLYEKWYLWYFMCNSYKKKIKKPDIPNYFLYNNCPYPPKTRICKPKSKNSLSPTREEKVAIVYELKSPRNFKEIVNVNLETPLKKSSKRVIKSQSYERVNLTKKSALRENKSDSFVLKTAMSPKRNKQKPGTPHSMKICSQNITCNVVTVDNALMKPLNTCGTDKTVNHEAKPVELDTKVVRSCFAKEFCEVKRFSPTDVTCSDNEIEEKINDDTTKENIAVELIMILKDAIDRNRQGISSYDAENPRRCAFLRNSEIPKIVNNYLSEQKKLRKVDINLSYSKATLLQELLRNISKLNMTYSELDSFVEAMDEELKSKGMIDLIEAKIENSDNTDDKEQEKLEKQNNVVTSNVDKKPSNIRIVEEPVQVYDDSDDSENSESLMKMTDSTRFRFSISGQLEKVYSTLSDQMALSPSMKLFHDKSLFARIAADTDAFSDEKHLKPLNAIFQNKFYRDPNKKIIPLRKILDHCPSILDMIPLSSRESLLTEGEENENYDSFYPEKIVGDIYSQMPKLYSENNEDNLNKPSAVSVPSEKSKVNPSKSAIPRTGSLKVNIPIEEGYYDKKLDKILDSKSVDNLIQIPSSSSKSENDSQKIIGGVHGKITDNEQKMLSKVRIPHILSEHQLIISSCKHKTAETLIRESVGMQTQEGKADAQSQFPQ